MMRIAKPMNVFSRRLFNRIHKMQESESNKNNSSQESETHPGVACDACGKQPIEGHRYKCVVCDDYDLCGSCKADGHHPGHNMMRIAKLENVFPQRHFKRIHKMQGRAAADGQGEEHGRQDQNSASTAAHQGGTNRRAPDCPVCFEQFVPNSRMFQCGQGHLVCGDCHRTEICPTCRGPMTGRAHAFEQFLRDGQ
eukprot:GFUD01104985.1.p1 GENE.GFUD01104985.1~~GFUD01104985.1.p1  ORF type:complete len:225 (-),score=46.01 GFUD01104985.1:168-752(-)